VRKFIARFIFISIIFSGISSSTVAEAGDTGKLDRLWQWLLPKRSPCDIERPVDNRTPESQSRALSQPNASKEAESYVHDPKFQDLDVLIEHFKNHGQKYFSIHLGGLKRKGSHAKFIALLKQIQNSCPNLVNLVFEDCEYEFNYEACQAIAFMPKDTYFLIERGRFSTLVNEAWFTIPNSRHKKKGIARGFRNFGFFSVPVNIVSGRETETLLPM